MPNQSSHPSRRAVVATGSTLLAGLGLGVALPGTSHAAGSALAAGPARGRGELAAYRPVQVSSVDHAPNPAEFVVDKLEVRTESRRGPGRGIRHGRGRTAPRRPAKNWRALVPGDEYGSHE
ncbi:hypothetical protein [Streptomyces sp. NPDC006645]|uniref:hypothetical protein n=1 Tax=unclassified Streptomyces TaxID=2593676 RepID=UPI0033A5B3CA